MEESHKFKTDDFELGNSAGSYSKDSGELKSLDYGVFYKSNDFIRVDYAEINIDSWRAEDDVSNLLEHFRELQEARNEVLVSVISEVADILQALKRFLMHSARRDMEQTNA